ncbi:hypothetical protein FE782_16555 [Paenibacillus antri]|uniref:Uncharacterized protein n=1 Tax=Paenibacillus antri TaxID=2582848 RepID=A0A5R9GCW0_9BACL|nr:hypothetical protein [Paenibacillus antri]TLS51004.1 hypothetical protein FE782_16555 [Paenibacillus antri]
MRHELRAGPLSVALEDGTLRYVRAGGREVVRQVYVAVRDRNWGTVPPRFTMYDVRQAADGFEARLAAETAQGDIDFIWEGVVTGTADGALEFRMRGEARSDFLRNRIGFCVLHPDTLAGERVVVASEDGETEGAFPERISPHQPFFGMIALRHGVPGASGLEVEIAFEGDLFEMEDQRNWTDASFKTYCTPLSRPFPAQVRRGDVVEQVVRIRVTGADEAGAGGDASKEAPVRLRAERRTVGALPPLGLLYDAVADGPIGPDAAALLKALPIDFLYAAVSLDDAAWEAALDGAAAGAAALGLPLAIAATAAADDRAAERLAACCARLARSGTRLRAFAAFGAGAVTTAARAEAARAALDAAGCGAVPLLGGSRANYAELNRAAEAGTMPYDRLDGVCLAMNPQVHAFDRASIVETLPMQALVVANAREAAGGAPIHAGPVTFTQRVNAAATGEAGARTHDPREREPFAAAWTLGSLRRLAEAGAASIAVCDAVGESGLVATDASGAAAPTPAYRRLFAALGPYRGALLGAVQCGDASVEAIAPLSAAGMRLLVANVSDAPRAVRLEAPGAVGFAANREGAEAPVLSEADGTISFELQPYEIARFDLNY